MSPLGSGLNFFNNATDKTPGTTGAFVDVDVSGDIPSGSTGVIVEIANTGGATNSGAVRKNGSTDGQTYHNIATNSHIYALIGVDTNRIFEAYINTSVQIWLVGYTSDGTDFLLNKVDKNVTTLTTWVDVDASADIPSDANGVIVELWNSTATLDLEGAIRNNGSTDNWGQRIIPNTFYIHALCGVDASRLFEAYIGGTDLKVSIVGYTKSPVVWKTNADDISIGVAATWTDVDVTTQTTADADGAIIETINTSATTKKGGQVRKGGSTDNRVAAIYIPKTGHILMAVGTDTGQVLQGYLESTAVDFKLLGYAKPGVTQKTVTDALALDDATPAITAQMTLADILGIADALPSGSPKALLAITDSLLLDLPVPTSGLNFFLNEIDKTPAITGSWQPVDVSGDGVPAGATGVILRLHNTDTIAVQNLAVRKNGSTDTRTPQLGKNRHTGAMVGIDTNRIFEAYVGGALAKVYLIGYTTDGTDFFTNSIDYAPVQNGVYQTVTASDVPNGATGVIVEFHAITGSRTGGVRAPTSTDDFYSYIDAGFHYYQVCGVNTSKQFEAKMDAAVQTMWVIGYFMPPVTFHINAINKALGSTGAWLTINYPEASADADGALWIIGNSSTTTVYRGGVRKPGSTSDSSGLITQTIAPATLSSRSLFSGLNANQQAEGYINNLAMDHYVIGYTKPAGVPLGITIAVSFTISELLALAEALVIVISGGIVQVSLTDSLSLADVLQLQAQLSVSDTLSLTDTLLAKLLMAISDTLSVTDTTSILAQLSQTDLLLLSDSLPAIAVSLATADVLALAETLSVQVSASITDTLALADLISIVISEGIVLKIVTDALALADVLSVQVTASVSDTLALADTLSVLVSRLITDALALAETLAVQVSASVTDTLELTDTLSVLVSQLITDTLELAEAISVVISGAFVSILISDALTLSDAALVSVSILIEEVLELVETLAIYLKITPAEYQLVVDALNSCLLDLTTARKKRAEFVL